MVASSSFYTIADTRSQQGGKRIVQTLTAAVTGIIAAFGDIPSVLHDTVLVAVLFVLMDTLTGCLVAWIAGEMRSRKILRGLLAKACQYTLLVSLFGGAALLGHSYAILGASFGIVIGIEAVSIIENIYLLETMGGVKFPAWAKKAINALGSRLEISGPTIVTGENSTVSQTNTSTVHIDNVTVNPATIAPPKE